MQHMPLWCTCFRAEKLGRIGLSVSFWQRWDLNCHKRCPTIHHSIFGTPLSCFILESAVHVSMVCPEAHEVETSKYRSSRALCTMEAANLSLVISRDCNQVGHATWKNILCFLLLIGSWTTSVGVEMTKEEECKSPLEGQWSVVTLWPLHRHQQTQRNPDIPLLKGTSYFVQHIPDHYGWHSFKPFFKIGNDTIISTSEGIYALNREVNNQSAFISVK